MKPNYLLQYDQVVTYLEAYLAFINRIFIRLQLESIKSPFRSMRQSRAALRDMRPLSGRSPEQYKSIIANAVTIEDKQNPYYEILMGDYNFDSLATGVLKQFPDFDVEKLKTVHEIKKEQITRTHVVRQTSGWILAGGTILLRSIPESIVARFMDYADF